MENSSENQPALSEYKTLRAESYHDPVSGYLYRIKVI